MSGGLEKEADGPREWLIRKDGYFYRPNCQGYTTEKLEAGRYTKAKAEAEAAVEPWHMSAIHQDKWPDKPQVADLKAELATERAAREKAERQVQLEIQGRDMMVSYASRLERERDEARAATAPAVGERFAIEHDGFTGTKIGEYVTLEGKRGVVLQQDGTRVVHVYGEKWLNPAPDADAGGILVPSELAPAVLKMLQGDGSPGAMTPLAEAVAKAIEAVPIMCGTYSLGGEDSVAITSAALAVVREKMRDHLVAWCLDEAGGILEIDFDGDDAYVRQDSVENFALAMIAASPLGGDKP